MDGTSININEEKLNALRQLLPEAFSEEKIDWEKLKATLGEQMKLFVDHVSEFATIENMVYELLLKGGKDLNSPIEKKESYYKINGTELILLLEKTTQEIMDAVIAEKPIKCAMQELNLKQYKIHKYGKRNQKSF